MDKINSRGIFVEKILKAIPDHIKSVDFLVDLLGISKVSAYRRLNCQLPFTYDEVVEISSELDISIEDIVHADSSDKVIFIYPKKDEFSIQNFFLNILEHFYENLLAENKSGTRKAIFAMNNLWLVYTVGSDNLFKFFYYKYLIQSSKNPLKICLEDIIIPTEIIEKKNKVLTQLKDINNTIFILDKLIYFNTIKDIQYYYRRKLINNRELHLIASDLNEIIKHTELLALNGMHLGVTHSLFLSYLNVYSNSMYIECDEKCKTFFYQYSMQPLLTVDKNLCSIHKRSLESLMKNSVLITASNEATQMDFFQHQKEYIRNLAEDKELYSL
ncbi:MAG: hypothetical protein LBV71_02960 [Prevotella sp.]|jgi:hypothetical protein|nr:hypothetical protein [Prevotella sp.]